MERDALPDAHPVTPRAVEGSLPGDDEVSLDYL